MATPARLPFENSIPCFLRIAKKRQIAAPAGHQKGIFFRIFSAISQSTARLNQGAPKQERREFVSRRTYKIPLRQF